MIRTNDLYDHSVDRVSFSGSSNRSAERSAHRAFSAFSCGRKIRIPRWEFRASSSRLIATSERRIDVDGRNYREASRGALSGKATIELRESREGHLRAPRCRLSRSVWREKVAITIARLLSSISSIEKIVRTRTGNRNSRSRERDSEATVALTRDRPRSVFLLPNEISPPPESDVR